jgi:hypothetical protein
MFDSDALSSLKPADEPEIVLSLANSDSAEIAFMRGSDRARLRDRSSTLGPCVGLRASCSQLITGPRLYPDAE